MPQHTFTKRQFVTGLGTLAVGGSGAMLLSSDSARAAVTMGELTVSDGATSTEELPASILPNR